MRALQAEHADLRAVGQLVHDQALAVEQGVEGGGPGRHAVDGQPFGQRQGQVIGLDGGGADPAGSDGFGQRGYLGPVAGQEGFFLIAASGFEHLLAALQPRHTGPRPPRSPPRSGDRARAVSGAPKTRLDRFATVYLELVPGFRS